MRKDLFKDLFGFDDQETEKLIDGFTKIFSDIFADESEDINETEENEKTEEDSENSYLHMKGSHYEDGKLVEKYNKEYVDGKCIKDEEYHVNKTIEGENTEHESCGCKRPYCECKEDGLVGRDTEIEQLNTRVEKLNKKIKRLTEINANLHNQNDDMKRYIDGLNDHIKSLEVENSSLKSVINNVKKCF